MRHALQSESWKNLLPDTIDWLGQVQLHATETAAGAHTIVAVKGNEDNKDAFVINAPKLNSELVRKISAAATGLGWKPSAGALHLVVDGAGFTLVSQSAVKVHAKQTARQLGLDAAKATKDLKIAHLAFAAADGLTATEVLDGYVSGLYTSNAFKGTRKKDLARYPAQLSLVGADVSAELLAQHLAFAKAQAFTRFLQDAPANYMNPIKLAEVAKQMAEEAGLKTKILDKEAMTKLGMGSFLSVSDGGSTEPRTIVIEIDGHDNSRTVALVGKGLTFDSGGISIKPSAGMEEMKYDMSGGAAVLGAAYYFGRVKPPVRVVCLVGATENMPSGTATKPGDVVRAMNGKTIEVLNTDAEGRLVLADVLHYAISEYKPELTIDIATLTGAVLMALGCVGAAVMSNDQAAAHTVIEAGATEGEPLWQLPLWPELEKETKGDVADLKNIAKPSVKGGTIMGGLFLKEFVGTSKWVHLDIAGTGWNCQALGYPASGGSTFGLRTLVAACLKFNQ
ncbi:MAG: leucyl aminopeptidase [Deltaproteobacteria bacterium]|nr:leucyl aminopeptidase [Deltaproteobacteria bacterium]